MNLPNKLTTVRIAIIPFFLIVMLGKWPAGYHYLLGLILFAAAALTDRLDGKIARARNQITVFGKFMDPLADKLLVVSALICLLADGAADPWAVILIVAREFMVTGLRLVAVEKGRVIAANRWGKTKTVSQVAAVILVLAFQFVQELADAGRVAPFTVWGMPSADAFALLGGALIWISVFFTIVSGGIYILQNIDVLKDVK
ncbi:MAG TPA: CDP-diacylglycerol--glycerol-3-phosphate 3-phosphatidyltransferase [Ruminococcaceae bacterium]|jgi:CDP-diacylglycerol--glycerol-3-phosphate 3-phosphatidyltransferase|nr:CDP-diacylglycerol--glycerol-3-phosphate 3-phosphatidyltransferase [Oscillospiraceae bacterium]